jgi:DNA replication ATP-dependent helicase Dna2
MEEEFPVDTGSKVEQATNKDNTNKNCSSVSGGDLIVPSKKTVDAPPLDSFLVLEVYLLIYSYWFSVNVKELS